MSVTMRSLGIDDLPAEDRLALARELWESVASEQPNAILDESRRTELRRRVREDDQSPDDSIPWDDVWARVEQRIAQ